MHPSIPRLLAIVSICVAAWRIGTMSASYSATYDEPAHIGIGLEWWDRGSYTYEQQHPPLARVSAAFGPYLLGAKAQGRADFWEEGSQALGLGPEHRERLWAARWSGWFWFAVAAIGLCVLGRACLPGQGWLWALVAFCHLPPVLAHASLATTDMPAVAGMVWAVGGSLAFLRLPSAGMALGAGLGAALAVGTKFSNVPFLGLVLLPVLFVHRSRLRDSMFWRYLPLALLVTFVILWSTYRFGTGRVPVLPWGVPLGQLYSGYGELRAHLLHGHPSYLLGEFRQFGWWYYFPVLAAFKMPLAWLAALALNFVWLLRSKGRGNLDLAAINLGALLAFASAMPSVINIGIRHMLPLMPLFTLGAVGLCGALGTRQGGIASWMPRANIALCCLLAAEVWMRRPDYLPWFNLAAGQHPERIAVDSNLDWGQDLYLLESRMSDWKQGPPRVSLFTRDAIGHPGLAALPPVPEMEPTPGIHVISKTLLEMECARRKAYCWLHGKRPVETIGSTLLVYSIGDVPLPQ